ncbi:hypothetical protein C8R45DRAFT_1113809 [Mycena sanguinolenta]|nr:hypothetical protein C8R45DRAFT_1113809 [Mycena sanguinolenta]
MLETPARHCGQGSLGGLYDDSLYGTSGPFFSCSGGDYPSPTPSANFLLWSFVTRPSHRPPHRRPVVNRSPSPHTSIHLSHQPSSVALSIAVPDAGSPKTCLAAAWSVDSRLVAAAIHRASRTTILWLC